MVDTGQVRLHVVTAGEGDPVLLLHGFPSFWGTWRHQIGVLAAAGFFVIAPDMRGYNLSEKPVGAHNYVADLLADDVVGLIRAMGHERVSLVGHDWGGAIAWATAARHPHAVQRMIVLSAPHPRIMRQRLFTPRQLLKCWYMLAIQLPFLPELLIRQPSVMRKCLRGTAARRDAFSEEDVAAHVQAMHQPGAATATLNYYRANLWRRASSGGSNVTPPTLVLWGARDPIFGVDLLDGMEKVGTDVRVQIVSDAGHWPHVEQPDEVCAALLAFLTPRPT